MTMRIPEGKADVTGGESEWKGARAQVRNNVLRVVPARSDGRPTFEVAASGVQVLPKQGRKRVYAVTTELGVFTVIKDCGCTG